MRHLFRVENIDWWGSNWPLGAKMCFFDPKIWIFWAKSQFFVLWSQFLSMGQITTIPGATTFPFRPPRNFFSFRAMGHPDFWPFRAIPTSLVKVPLTLDRRQQNLVRCPGHQKMTHNDNGPGPGRNYEKMFGRKVFFCPKSVFLPRKTPEIW